MTEYFSPETLPLFRKTDPSTSSEAVENHQANGNRQTNKGRVLEAVRTFPGKTSAEYSKMLGMDRTEAGRRLPDLYREGLVRKGAARLCTEKHTKAKTWWPA